MSMPSSYSVTGLSSPTKDDAPPSPPISLEADVLDRDGDKVYTESGCREMTYGELHEILAWMPAKAAIRYSSSLCTWSRGIHSDLRFVENQCTRSYGHDNSFFLQHKCRSFSHYWEQKAIEFKVLPCEMGSTFGIPSESLGYLSKCRVLHSSNGLLLLDKISNRTLEFIVCNPATREWATLSIPKGFEVAFSDINPLIECYPWGHDTPDGVKFPYDYTIALPVQTRTKIPDTIRHGLLIYSNGRWEEDLWEVSIEGRILSLDKPVAFFSDATKGLVVHYFCHSNLPENPDHGFGEPEHTYMEPFIAAFDIREKKLIRQIKLPVDAWTSYQALICQGTRKNMWIEKWNENSIILVRWAMYGGLFGSIAAWVLDDYGCKGESWRLVMDKTLMEMWNYHWDWTMGVGVASGRGLLIVTTPPPLQYHPSFEEVKSRVFLYVLEGENKGKMELVGDHHFGLGSCVRFVPYSNTLRPVSVKNAQTCTY